MFKHFPILAKSILAIALLSACSTNIHPKNETIVPSKMPLGKFSNVTVKPLTVDHSTGDQADKNAITKIDQNLTACLKSVFKNVTQDTVPPYPQSTLIIEPHIEDIDKKTIGGRIMLGPMEGSSAVLLGMRYTNADANEIIADPVFYAKANAFAGAFTFGAMDNVMLDRIATNACDYARNNY